MAALKRLVAQERRGSAGDICRASPARLWVPLGPSRRLQVLDCGISAIIWLPGGWAACAPCQRVCTERATSLEGNRTFQHVRGPLRQPIPEGCLDRCWCTTQLSSAPPPALCVCLCALQMPAALASTSSIPTCKCTSSACACNPQAAGTQARAHGIAFAALMPETFHVLASNTLMAALTPATHWLRTRRCAASSARCRSAAAGGRAACRSHLACTHAPQMPSVASLNLAQWSPAWQGADRTAMQCAVLTCLHASCMCGHQPALDARRRSLYATRLQRSRLQRLRAFLGGGVWPSGSQGSVCLGRVQCR